MASADLPKGWTEHIDPSSGNTFYYNEAEGETCWERPKGSDVVAATTAPLPANWTEQVDPSTGRSYYHNVVTQESTWERPILPTVSEPAALPAGCTAHVDEVASGRSLDGNAATGERTQERPGGDANVSIAAEESSPASSWTEQVDPSSGKTYYANSLTGESTWERPVVAQLPEAAPLLVGQTECSTSMPAAAHVQEPTRSGEVLVVKTSEEFWRVQVESVYRVKNPQKLMNVPALLKKYEGQEAVLYAKVCKTYGLNPTKFYADPKAWEDEEGNAK
mmetsp:Transcript_29405/g.80376  ORF Transcript_29405/g.80376 Transcript_29405/m.80376 type:complete len:277 (-) Transcript_29405:215-1045(-)